MYANRYVTKYLFVCGCMRIELKQVKPVTVTPYQKKLFI